MASDDEIKKWKSKESVRKVPLKDQLIGSQELCVSIRCSKRLSRRVFVARSVMFEPGACTAWHTHPLGQTLIVTSGLGWAQREGGPSEEIRPGDVVWFLPNEKHWHGATPTIAMTHIAIQETLDGNVVDWMQKVSDAEYQRS